MTSVDLFRQFANALQWGSFYALIALGYSMVYGILMLFNFAHGDIFMVGAYIGFFVASALVGLAARGFLPLPGWSILVLTILITMFLMFIGAIAFTRFFSITRLPTMLAEFIAAMQLPRVVVMICILDYLSMRLIR